MAIVALNATGLAVVTGPCFVRLVGYYSADLRQPHKYRYAGMPPQTLNGVTPFPEERCPPDYKTLRPEKPQMTRRLLLKGPRLLGNAPTPPNKIAGN